MKKYGYFHNFHNFYLEIVFFYSSTLRSSSSSRISISPSSSSGVGDVKLLEIMSSNACYMQPMDHILYCIRSNTTVKFVFRSKSTKIMNYSQHPYRGFSRKIAPPPSNREYTNLDTSSGRLTNHHSRPLHMVYPKTSGAILVAAL